MMNFVFKMMDLHLQMLNFKLNLKNTVRISLTGRSSTRLAAAIACGRCVTAPGRGTSGSTPTPRPRT